MNRYRKRRIIYFYFISLGYIFLLLLLCVTRFNFIGYFLGIPPTHVVALNLIPFKSIIGGLNNINKLSWDAFGNMVMFIPLGILFGYYYKKRFFFFSTMLCFITSCGIEISQYILKTGAVDIDDVILNSTGGIIGATIFMAISGIAKKKIDVTKSVVEIGASIFPPFLLFYIFDMFFIANPYHFHVIHLIPFLLYFFLIRLLLIKDLTLKRKMVYFAVVAAFTLYFFFVFL